MKQCTVCKEEKELSEFYKHTTSKDGKSWRCKVCDNKAVKAHRHKHRERYLVRQQKANRLSKYNLTQEEYMKLFEEQRCVCAICGKQDILQVDHDHETGLVRGLLCPTCNRGLGMFYDNHVYLEAAILYLKKKINV